MTTCRIHEKHEYKLCSREVWEKDPEGLCCLLHSRQKNKDLSGEFTKELEAKIENEDYDFNGIFFPAETNIFRGLIFSKKVDFTHAHFAGKD